MCARNCFLIIVGRSGADAGESPPINRRKFVKRSAAAVTFAVEHTGVFVGESQFFQRCLHFSASTGSLSSLPAELAHQFNRFINHVRGNIERGTKANRVLAGAKRQNSEVEEAMPKFFARFRIGKIERKEYSSAARGGNQRLFRLQLAQSIDEIGADFAGVIDQTFLLDDPQIMG